MGAIGVTESLFSQITLTQPAHTYSCDYTVLSRQNSSVTVKFDVYYEIASNGHILTDGGFDMEDGIDIDRNPYFKFGNGERNYYYRAAIGNYNTYGWRKYDYARRSSSSDGEGFTYTWQDDEGYWHETLYHYCYTGHIKVQIASLTYTISVTSTATSLNVESRERIVTSSGNIGNVTATGLIEFPAYGSGGGGTPDPPTPPPTPTTYRYVRISNGSNFDNKYIPYIYTTSGWQPYTPYIRTASNWEPI